MVQGVREMCDVCEANLFNYHWACGRCGFVVCVDCYLDRKNDVIRSWPNMMNNGGGGHHHKSDNNSTGNNSSEGCEGKDNFSSEVVNKHDQRDKYSWLLCTNNRTQHDLEKLMLTQIITGETLEKVNDKLQLQKVVKKEKDETILINGDVKCNGIAQKEQVEGGHEMEDLKNKEYPHKETKPTTPLDYFKRSQEKDYSWYNADRIYPIKSFSITDTKDTYGAIAHSWLCDGKVLRIDANSCATDENMAIKLFQEVWHRGQPSVFADVTRKMDVSLWTPHHISKNFGSVTTEFVDAVTGLSLGNHSIETFFDGFSIASRRTVKDNAGNQAIVRLRGWPPQEGEEFTNLLPHQAADFQQALPLPIYTASKMSTGMFNLSTSLPDVFMRPDVGPRALVSYGAGRSDDDQVDFNAVVNLHLESSDTLSLLAHAEVPRDLDRDAFRQHVIKLMDSSGCDITSRRRVLEAKELPGILWHIFHPADADKVRNMLNRKAAEEIEKQRQKMKESRLASSPNNKKIRGGRKGMPKEDDIESSDPDLDMDDVKMDTNYDALQFCSLMYYLDDAAIATLKKDYGVVPFVIAQFPGEAVVIPAGAAFQVN